MELADRMFSVKTKHLETIMEWKGRRQSGNVEDSRGKSYRGGSGGGGFGILIAIYRALGWKGILVAMVLGLALWKMGIVDSSMFLGGGTTESSQQVAASPEEEERLEFVKVVLGDTEDIFSAEFARLGKKYEMPKLNVYRARVPTACGTGESAMGPFYCPGDKKVYIDLSFYDELDKTFNAPGDFAQAYVVAHEVGHHVQKLLGDSDRVNAMRGKPEYNQYSVRLELQADFYAGVWAHHSRKYLNRGDIEEAMQAANAIGDDAIQKKAQGRVVPHTFTHGTSEQRMRWFNKGLVSGKIEDGDTFSIPYESL